MEALPLLSIGFGAALGACLRWWLSLLFNALLPSLPLGTLAANLLGGYLIGLALPFFTQHPALPPEIRLFLITGFLGGLTTFSTFSAEVVGLLLQQEFLWALTAAASHLFGSLLMTLLGILTMKWFLP
ncbi:fluoride efflux transporter CrcB [Candidatus Magnetaquicoccus inordinatus]|uniref:fluoride efflux transporter CrcB n=1 Tax=Candidatus Magnetaquicoccus inordinatus TaxID=2496818 RepID=UPI00102B4BE4|nr:fluoride efflux transporter CrcB [Candidatus Magnetaquicoccus inordinatus]